MPPSQDPSISTSIVKMIVLMKLIRVRQRSTQPTGAEHFTCVRIIMTLANHWVRQRMTQPNMMIIKMSMEFELKRCALEKLQRRICCTNYWNMESMGKRKIQEGCFC